ncbi:Uncharacterized protein BP5553_04354 [Venustampulla echinocandica]|uniref:NAD(P)-binding protein n=1 Tax=Venustampulla echinocandica TaxID=2656787 RepID=A0A370TWV6_9HELO|nr:Uncharacterized protein BP5553_04354 [Venustampulla echinocandica]RDL40014.1 Uncharacterized protein BP5553_04354 [Venustampulla echinocandica]
MVTLADVKSSNALIPSTLPPGLVAVFVGATNGIGEVTLKKFAKQSRQPRVYLVGRSQDAADRIIAECRMLNSAGEYIYIKADVSLIRVVDEVCDSIKAKEKTINLLFLSAGLPVLDRSETSEHLHLLAALTFYSRFRFITNFLPLLQRASGLRRVVTVAGGGIEGKLDSTDFPALRIRFIAIRGHIATLITLGLESIARNAPEVSFVHDYPGTVSTALTKNMPGILGYIARASIYFFGRWICVPLEESGERHLYLATSARFPPASGDGDNSGVPLGDGFDVAQGTTGAGSGVYSVGWDCESASAAVQKLLAGYREKGLPEDIWRHTESEFKRITVPEARL